MVKRKKDKRVVREDLIRKRFYLIFKWLGYESSFRDLISK